jgi:hypothetical protein
MRVSAFHGGADVERAVHKIDTSKTAESNSSKNRYKGCADLDRHRPRGGKYGAFDHSTI